MRFWKAFIIVVSIVSLTASALAQSPAATTAPEMPKAEPVVSHIPAGALGFVVINDFKSATGHLDAYLANIGLGELVGGFMPGGVLETLRTMLQLGEGFNPNGGLAVVMLDPQQFGVDLAKLMKLTPAEPSDEADTAPPQLPFVVFIAGSGVAEVFGKYPTVAAGDYTQVTLPIGPLLGAKCGSYVILSPSAKALDAVLGAETKIALTAEKADMLGRSDLAVHINMNVAGPILTKLLEKLGDQFAAMQQMGAPGMSPKMTSLMQDVYLPMYVEIISQLDSADLSVQLAETGLIIEEMGTFRPDSSIGKAVAAFKSGSAPLLDRVVDRGYVLAIGVAGEYGQEAKDVNAEFTDKMFASDLFAELDDETKTRIKELSLAGSDQFTGVQMVIGGAPQGSGAFGLSYVIECKDAEKVKELLGESIELASAMIKAMVEDEDVKQLKITYAKDVEVVGGVSVDAINIDHPDLAEMDEDDAKKLTAALGENRIRLLVAKADDNHVVVTLGGSKAYMAQALEAARGNGNGKILAGEEVAKALEHMPKNLAILMLFNVGNAFELGMNFAKTIDPDADVPPFQITTTTPIAVGAGTAGSSVHVVAYVPNDLIREVVGAGMMMFMPQPKAQPAPSQGEGDF